MADSQSVLLVNFDFAVPCIFQIFGAVRAVEQSWSFASHSIEVRLFSSSTVTPNPDFFHSMSASLKSRTFWIHFFFAASENCTDVPSLFCVLLLLFNGLNDCALCFAVTALVFLFVSMNRFIDLSFLHTTSLKFCKWPRL
jgi:hypothetical protein